MVLSLQSEHRLIRQRIPGLTASGQSQRKPEENYVVRTQKKGKDLTKNTDFFPCCTSISPRNVSKSTFVLSSLFRDSMSQPGGRRGPRTCTSFCMSENQCFIASKDRFVDVRCIYDCRVAFLEGADEI